MCYLPIDVAFFVFGQGWGEFSFGLKGTRVLVEDWLFSILLLVEGCVGFSEVVSISAEFYKWRCQQLGFVYFRLVFHANFNLPVVRQGFMEFLNSLAVLDKVQLLSSCCLVRSSWIASVGRKPGTVSYVRSLICVIPADIQSENIRSAS